MLSTGARVTGSPAGNAKRRPESGESGYRKNRPTESQYVIHADSKKLRIASCIPARIGENESRMAEGLSRAEEYRLEKALRTAALDGFPNPHRTGCPTNISILRDLAAKKLRPTDPVIQHVAECSPCFREVKQFQNKRQRATLLKLFGGAALCIIFRELSLHSAIDLAPARRKRQLGSEARWAPIRCNPFPRF